MVGPKRYGVTLIEILVVIGIIALLAAIAFPVFTSVKKNAKITICKSNVSEIVRAVQHYLNDYKDVFPAGDEDNANDPGENHFSVRYHNLLGKQGAATGPGSGAWSVGPNRRVLNKYLGSGGGREGTAECPLDNGAQNDNPTKAYDWYGTSYVYMDRKVDRITIGTKMGRYGIWTIEGHRFSEIKKPNKKMVIADVPLRFNGQINSNANWDGEDAYNQWHGPGFGVRDDDEDRRQLLKVSMGFVDGHVAEVTRKIRSSPNSGLSFGDRRVLTSQQLIEWQNTPYY